MDRYIDALRELFQNPTSNLTAAAIGIAALILLVLILALAALIFILPGEDEHGDDHDEQDERDEQDDRATDEADRPSDADSAEREDGVEKKDEVEVEAEPLGEDDAFPVAGRRLSTRISFWIAVALLLLGTTAMYATTSSDAYCASSCHSMTSASDTHRRASHAKVSCAECHESGVLDAVPKRLRMVALSAISSRPEASPIDSRRCESCHDEVLDGVVTSGSIRVSHEQIAEGGAPCTSCHADIGHGADGSARRSVMNECIYCHDNKKAPGACSTCHVGDIGKATLERRRFSRIKLPKPTCSGCHSEESCDECHGLRMPHPAGFGDPKLHARGGAFQKGRQSCYRCHTWNDCDRCHTSLDGGHGPTWPQQHQQYSWADGDGHCRACHKPENFCAVCHDRRPK